MAEWSHKPLFSYPWARLNTDYYINDLYLPAVGLQYRYDFELQAYPSPGSYYSNFWVELIVWVETPNNRNDILNSPFAQKVRLNFTSVPLANAWWFSTEKITDRPSELGFSGEEYEYPLYEGARQGYFRYGGGTGTYVQETWQSPAYSVEIPRGSRLRVFRRTAGYAGLVGAAILSVRTAMIGLSRIPLAKDKERRIFSARENKQVELVGAASDMEPLVSLTTETPNPYLTTSEGDKSSTSIVSDDSGSIGVAYVSRVGKTDSIMFLRGVSRRVGELQVKIVWEGYANPVLLCAPTQQKPQGIFGTYNNLLCYRKMISISSQTTAAIGVGGTEVPVANPEKFRLGQAVLQNASIMEEVEIVGITSDKLLMLASPVSLPFYKLSRLSQDTFNGLSMYDGEFHIRNNRLYYPALHGTIISYGSANAGSVEIGTKSYIFLKEGPGGFSVVASPGNTKEVTLGGTRVNVDDIPAKSVLIAYVDQTAASPISLVYSGTVVAYKAKSEYCGAVVDRTGRISVLFHNDKDKEIAAYSEDTGVTFTWGRVQA